MDAVMINMSNFLPFVFHFDPETVRSKKASSWHKAPNIGGASKKNYFTGFDNEEISFRIMLLDQVSPFGVHSSVEWFKQLQEPDPGITAISGSFFGNENYPPPQVLFQYGVSLVPLVWDVVDLEIEKSIFKGDEVGSVGIAERADIDITLSLDTDNDWNRANQIAKKVSIVSGSVSSLFKEFQALRGERKELVTFL